MFPGENPLYKLPDNSKAGITVCLNQNEGGEPFEATVYFKKQGKNMRNCAVKKRWSSRQAANSGLTSAKTRL
jgi:hypothetical protein